MLPFTFESSVLPAWEVLLYQHFVGYCYVCVRMLLYMCPHTSSTESSQYCSSMRTHNIQEMTVTHISLSHPHSTFASCLPTPPTYVPSHYYIYMSSYYLFLSEGERTSNSVFLFSPPLPQILLTGVSSEILSHGLPTIGINETYVLSLGVQEYER